MADIKISQLPAATTPLAGTEEVPLTQNGTTKKATVADIAAKANAVTAVTGTAPVISSGGLTPAISMPSATTSRDGYLTSTDWNTFNGKGFWHCYRCYCHIACCVFWRHSAGHQHGSGHWFC
jgi:hypothetical protein